MKELGLVLSLLWREMPPQSSGIADYAENSTTRKAKKPRPTKTTANNTTSPIETIATTNPKDMVLGRPSKHHPSMSRSEVPLSSEGTSHTE